ncbi:MAG: WD40 repeat domain-containing protein [Nigerium sp.]|nr:WD40 repeat domain-containing protein [Nigerium sp.]
MRPPQSRTALASVLASARQASGLSIRRAASVAGVPPATAQGWLDGKHLPTPALTPAFLRLLSALDLVRTDADRDAWTVALALIRAGNVIDEPPYVGLRPYTAEDAAVYVGRERAYEELVTRCIRGTRTGPITAVVIGDSGAGKSSLLGAGLVGRALAPGGPLQGLTPLWVAPSELTRLIPPPEQFLILLDQFEQAQELPAEQQDAVFDALATMPDRATVVVALTSAAFGFAMRDDRFAQHLDTHVRVSNLSKDEYRRIIEEPARLHGRAVTAAMTELALRDLYEYGEPRPGAVLPLLSGALRRAWSQARGDELTSADYLASGGLWSSLDLAAEAIHDALDPGQRPLAQRLMLSLVSVDEGHTMRRRIPMAQLSDELRPVADAFVSARLLNVRDGELEIAHDALLTRWKRLQDWIDDESASLLIGRRIHMASRLWDEGGRRSDALMPVEANLWDTWAHASGTPLLSAVEQEFIAASLQHAAAVAQEERDTIRRLRTRQRVAIGAGAAAVLMAASAVSFGWRSEQFRARAEDATRSAQARQIALVADEVRPATPNLAAQLSVAALTHGESVETRSAVVQSAGVGMPTRSTSAAGDTHVAVSPDGSTIVRGDNAGNITVWRDGLGGANVTSVPSGGNQLFTVAVAEVGGRLLAFVGGQQTGGVWDVTEAPRSLGDFGIDTVVYSAAWVGRTVLFGTLEGDVRRVDFADAAAPSALPSLQTESGTLVKSLAAADDWVLAGGPGNAAILFSTSGQRLADLPIPGRMMAASVSPDGTEVLGGFARGGAILWQVTRDDLGQPAFLPRSALALPTNIHSVLHGGDEIYAAGAFGEVQEYSRTGELQRRWPARNAVVSLAASGRQLLVGSTEGVTDAWPLAAPNLVAVMPAGQNAYDLTHGGEVVLVGTSSGARTFKLDGDEWRPLPLLTAQPRAFNAMYAMSGDGAVVTNQTTDGRLLTFARDGDGYHEVDDASMTDTLADIRLSRTGRYLAIGRAGEVGYELFRREGTGWRSLGRLPAWPSGCAFSDDESLFVAMSSGGQGFTLWRLTGDEPELIVTETMVNTEVPSGFTFSRSGVLAVGDTPGDVTLYSLADPARPVVMQQLRDARSSISQLTFSADGRTLLASTREGLVWVWAGDGHDRFELDLRLKTRSASVPGVTMIGEHIVMSLSEGRIVAWPRDSRAQRPKLCEQFGTPLSNSEWERLVPGVDRIDGCA